MVSLMSIAGGIQQQLQQREQQIIAARREIESFQPRIAQSQMQLRQATPQKQVAVRTQEFQRLEAKQKAVQQVSAAEKEFQKQKAEIMPQIIAAKQAAQAEADYQLAQDIAYGAKPAQLLIGASAQVKKFYGEIAQGKRIETAATKQESTFKELGLKPIYTKGVLTGFEDLKREFPTAPGTKVTYDLKDVSKYRSVEDLAKLEKAGLVAFGQISDPRYGTFANLASYSTFVKKVKEGGGYLPSFDQAQASAQPAAKPSPISIITAGMGAARTAGIAAGAVTGPFVVPTFLVKSAQNWLAPRERPAAAPPTPAANIIKVSPYVSTGYMIPGVNVPKKEIPAYNVIPGLAKALQTGVSNVAVMTGKGYERILSENLGYKGIRQEALAPLLIPATAFQYGIPKFAKGQVPAIPKSEVRVLTPEQLGKGITVGVKFGAYTAPYLGTGLLASNVVTGYQAMRTPVYKPQLLTIPSKPIGVSDVEWKSYVRQIEEYNAAQKAAVRAAQTQKVLGAVEFGLSAGFLGYKGYKAITKPYSVVVSRPEPISKGYAVQRPFGEKQAIQANLFTLQPGRTIVQTNPLKEVIFFGTGRRIDLATQIVEPSKLRLIQTSLVAGEKGARGIGTGIKVGKTTVRTIQIPVGKAWTPFGDMTQPAVQAQYVGLFKSARPRTIKPFEIGSARYPEITSVEGLTPVETKLIRTLGGLDKTNQFFRSDVIQIPGVRVLGNVRAVSGPSPMTYTIKPLTRKEVLASVQVTKIPKQPYFEFGPAQFFETQTAVKPFSGLGPVTRGKAPVIPIEVAVYSKPVKRFFEYSPELQVPTAVEARALEPLVSLARTPIITAIPKAPFGEISKAVFGLAAVPGLAARPAARVVEIPKFELAAGKAVITVQQPQIEIAKEVSRAGQASANALAQVEVPKITPIQVTVPPQILTPRPQPTPPVGVRGPDVIKPYIDLSLSRRKKERRIIPRPTKEELFIAYIKRRGKFLPVSKPAPYEVVRARGIAKLKGTLAASLMIKSTKGRAVPFGKPPAEFRFGRAGKEPTILVQKRRARLGTFGERAEIIRSRRIKFI